MSVIETKEAQNQSQIDDFRNLGPATMGPWTSHIWRHDPRHIGFLLARYKFVAKMLGGRDKVMEVGCGDAVGTPVVLQTVKKVHGVDFEPLVLNDAIARYKREGVTNASFAVHDMLKEPVNDKFDAAFSLDVIEHIPLKDEATFIDNIVASLKEQGVLIVGTPNITANAYASEGSKAGHINLKTGDALRDALARRFNNVFSFSMNDEVVHTGYSPMAHYLICMGVGVKQ